MQVALNFNEAAAYLHISRPTLETWVRRGIVSPPHQKHVRGHRTFSLSDLQEWLAASPERVAQLNRRMIVNAEKRTADERAATKAQRVKEAARAAREAQKRDAAPIPMAETADADLEPVAPIDPVLALAHAPRRASRHVRNRTLPPADSFTNVDLDRKLGGGSALPKLRWHL